MIQLQALLSAEGGVIHVLLESYALCDKVYVRVSIRASPHYVRRVIELAQSWAGRNVAQLCTDTQALVDTSVATSTTSSRHYCNPRRNTLTPTSGI